VRCARPSGAGRSLVELVYQEPIEEAGCRWFVMADPEGNEFCCVENSSRANDPSRWAVSRAPTFRACQRGVVGAQRGHDTLVDWARVPAPTSTVPTTCVVTTTACAGVSGGTGETRACDVSPVVPEPWRSGAEVHDRAAAADALYPHVLGAGQIRREIVAGDDHLSGE
jgi:hypothetical protein